jgi:hypothetical protein
MSNVTNHKQVAHGVVEFNIQPSSSANVSQADEVAPVVEGLVVHPISTGPAPGPVIQHATGPALAPFDEDQAAE